MKAKLTDIGLRSYQPRATQYAIGDAACPGLCVRITPKGVKSFAYAHRTRALARSSGSRSAATRTCRRHRRATMPRWDKFDLRRETATVVERSLRETLDGEPTTMIKAVA